MLDWNKSESNTANRQMRKDYNPPRNSERLGDFANTLELSMYLSTSSNAFVLAGSRRKDVSRDPLNFLICSGIAAFSTPSPVITINTTPRRHSTPRLCLSISTVSSLLCALAQIGFTANNTVAT